MLTCGRDGAGGDGGGGGAAPLGHSLQPVGTRCIRFSFKVGSLDGQD